MMTTRARSVFSMHRIKRSVFLAFATAVCWILMISNAAVIDIDVIDLTSKNFGSKVGFGDDVWLIEFYTPTCSHCVNFAPTYKKIGRTLHAAPEDKIHVARVDCSEEKALMTRFGIEAFPSFYVVKGWEVYEFVGARSESTLVDFAQGGYKKQKVGVTNPKKRVHDAF